MPSEDCTYTFALLLPMSNFMAFGPPIFFMSCRDKSCPSTTKSTTGSTQLTIKLISGDICSTISPENSAPES